MNVTERIKFILEDLAITKKELARIISVAPAAINGWEDRNEIGKASALKINKILHYNIAWLLTGEGESSVEVPVQQFDFKVNKKFEDYEYINLYNVKLSAGLQTEPQFVDVDEPPIYFPTSWFKRNNVQPYNLKAMYVKGDSMEPEFFNGDIVVIDTSDCDIYDGAVYAISYNGHLFIKKIMIHSDGIHLVSINPTYKDIVVDKNENTVFTVFGKKVWRGG